MSEHVSHEVVKDFAELFVGCRQPFGEETAAGWQTRHSELTDNLIRDHLEGTRTVGVRPGGSRAGFIALEVDLGDREAHPVEVHDKILGDEGYRTWAAIRSASEGIGIPPVHWIASYSGSRSLHFWLLLEEALPYGTAHRIAQAIASASARQGVKVCTVYPSNSKAGGKVLRLPWGRHRRTLAHAHFVTLGLFALTPRPHFPQDLEYLSRIAELRVPQDVLEQAAQNAQGIPSPEPARPQQTTSKGSAEPFENGAPEPARPQQTTAPSLETIVDAVDPSLLIAVGRPCIAAVIAKGVPEGHRHSVGHLVRTELKHCGLTLEQAQPIYLRFAQACTPPWAQAEAVRDLETNWAVTDTAQRHSCKSASPATLFLRSTHCRGTLTCTALRKETFEQVWGGKGLSGNARILYAALCKLEGEYLLRPGDRIRTTVAQLTEAAGLTERTFKGARKELKAHNLIAWKTTSHGRGKGIHSVYWRTYPLPTPARQSVQEPCTAAEDTAKQDLG